jgi:hypothetical protein
MEVSTDESTRRALVSNGLDAAKRLTWKIAADSHRRLWTALSEGGA